MAKSEDTQQLSSKEIQDAGINYRQRRPPQNQNQPMSLNMTIVLVTAFIVICAVAIVAIIGSHV